MAKPLPVEVFSDKEKGYPCCLMCGISIMANKPCDARCHNKGCECPCKKLPPKESGK